MQSIGSCPFEAQEDVIGHPTERERRAWELDRPTVNNGTQTGEISQEPNAYSLREKKKGKY